MSTPRTGRKISQLPVLETASLDVYVVGYSGDTTYRLTLDSLGDAVLDTISSSLDSRIDFLEAFSASYNEFSTSVDSQLNDNSASALEGRLDILESFTSSYATTGSNSFTGSQSIDGAITASYFKGDGSALTNVTGALSLAILDEGVYKGHATTLNFTGSNVTTTIVGGLALVQILGDSTNLSTASFGSFTSSYYVDSASFDARILAATNEQSLTHLVTTSSFNSFTSSINLELESNNDELNLYTQSLKDVIVISGSGTGSITTIKGNLNVDGENSILKSTNIHLYDNIIELNSMGEYFAGLLVKDPVGVSTVSGSLKWNANLDRWEAGKDQGEITSISKILLADGDNVISSSAQIADYGYAITGSNQFIGNQYFTGSLIPEGSGSHSLGSLQNPWQDLYITSASVKLVKDGQVITILSANENGDLIISSSQGDLNLNYYIDTASFAKVDLVNTLIQATSSYETTGRNILSGSIESLLPNGVISSSAQITITESQISDLTHTDITSLNQFTESIENRVNELENWSSSLDTTFATDLEVQIVSSSVAATIGIISQNTGLLTTQSFNNYTASISTASLVDRLNSLESNTGSYLTELPNGTISSSAQIDGFETTGRGILSGSIESLLPIGVISGSSQITITESQISDLTHTDISALNQFTQSFDTISSSFDSRIIAATNEQFLGGFVTTSSFNEYTASISTASLVDRLNNLETNTSSYETTGRGILSGSISYSDLTNTPSGIISSSEQFPNGLISSSTQISDLGFVTGSYLELNQYNSFTQSIYEVTQSFYQLSGSFNSIDFVELNNITASYLLLSQSFNTYTASISTASLVDRLNQIESISGSWITESETGSFLTSLPSGIISSSAQIDGFETTGRGILSGSIESLLPNGVISSSVQITITESQISDLTHTDISALNQFTQSYNTDSASFDNRITSLTVAGTPPGTISGSEQITAFGFVSGSYETTGRGILSGSVSYNDLTNIPIGLISSSAQFNEFETTGRSIISSSQQIADLGFAKSGGDAIFNNVTANQYIVSSSVYYVTASYSSGSTISGNSLDDTHQFTGSVLISGSLTANLTNGHMWVGNSLNKSYEIPTSSFATSASFNSFTSSYLIDSASAAANRTATSASLATFQASLGVTSTPFNYSSVINPTNYVLVSYPTASFNGGSMDIIITRPSDSTAVSVNCLLASFGGTGTIAANGSRNSGAGAPNPSFDLAVSGSNMNIRISVSAGTYTIKGVARLF